MDISDLDTFFAHYLECALWSSTDSADEGGGCPIDDNYGIEDIAPVVLANLKRECADFIEGNLADLADMPAEQAGHDFWLTRNGHGAGFWDRGLGALGRRLSDAARTYGTCDLYIGDDGQVWALGYERAQRSGKG